MAPDRELVQLAVRLSARDPRAFDEVFHLFRDTVYVIGVVDLGDPEEAEDLVQETFRRVWSSARTLKDPARLRPWLYAIARNQVADLVQRSRRRPVPVALTDREVVGSRNEPHEGAMKREAAAAVRRLLQTVPERFRLILALRLLEEMSYDEIARQLDVPMHCVKNAIARGGRILYEKIRSQPDLAPELERGEP